MRKHAYNFIDLTGKRFGRLVVLKEDNQQSLWLCKCDCGNLKNILGASLRSTNTNSCGCWERKSHGMSRTRIYKIWTGILSRCNNPKSVIFKYYGGRGITVCEKWQKFEGFYEDMKEGYEDNLSIDRISSKGNYEKSNCRWATPTQQANNTKRNHLITYNGKTQTVKQWSREIKIPYDTIIGRINKMNWSIERAFSTPLLK